MGFIYCLTSPSGKQYIGQTINSVELRWKQHKLSIRYNKGRCPLLCNAIKKYGANNFNIEILIKCENNDLNMYEIQFINLFDTLKPNGYNILAGGELNTEDNKKIISDNLKKYYKLNPKPKGERKYDDNDELPKYLLKSYRKGEFEGYKIAHHPKCKTKCFTSLKISMEKKLEMAIDFLHELDKESTPKYIPKELPEFISYFKNHKKEIIGFKVTHKKYNLSKSITNSKKTLDEKLDIAKKYLSDEIKKVKKTSIIKTTNPKVKEAAHLPTNINYKKNKKNEIIGYIVTTKVDGKRVYKCFLDKNKSMEEKFKIAVEYQNNNNNNNNNNN